MNTDAKRHYAMLGLNPSCSDEDIRHAFRRRAKELHPDAETGDAAAFIRLKRAYDTLSDPGKRAVYDRACTTRLRRVMHMASAPPPPKPNGRSPRAGGMSVARYVAAFLFVGGLSFGAIQAMISYADAPPPRAPRPASLLRAPGGEAERPKGEPGLGDSPSRVGAGFFDTANPTGAAREERGSLLRPRRGASE